MSDTAFTLSPMTIAEVPRPTAAEPAPDRALEDGALDDSAAVETARRTIRRKTARAVLLDHHGRVLLLDRPAKIRDVGDRYFHTPGGAIEPGETPAEAAARELAEELDFQTAPSELGTPVATCYSLQQRIATGEFVAADDVFFLLRTDAARTPAATPHAWLDPDAMDAAPARILPRGLADLVRRLLAEGPPLTPIHIRW
ncbi:NUDIX domain-containing protein [Glycomyces artemisiae]|uniref:NUDIX domain-containing protein n=2 Tax=Glycomyces artemisiae TaxID=1076443 RepID=A0A2T0UDA0_9ACTN|nr:NUDIX domain-containing protein [Glycomyces artemisiae]